MRARATSRSALPTEIAIPRALRVRALVGVIGASLALLLLAAVLRSPGYAALMALVALATVTVLGKSEPVRIYELLGAAGSLPEPCCELLRVYAEGLAAYRLQAWDDAESHFLRCLAAAAQDGPATLMLARVRTLRDAPPDPGWTGVWNLTEK